MIKIIIVTQKDAKIQSFFQISKFFKFDSISNNS